MPSAGGVHVIIRALCRWHFQPGGGPEYCRACRDDGLPCARGEPGADGRLCPYREHALISRQEHEAWDVLLACQGQLRLAPSGHVIGIDMDAALKLGAARGYDLAVLSELLPAAEAGLVEALCAIELAGTAWLISGSKCTAWVPHVIPSGSAACGSSPQEPSAVARSADRARTRLSLTVGFGSDRSAKTPIRVASSAQDFRRNLAVCGAAGQVGVTSGQRGTARSTMSCEPTTRRRHDPVGGSPPARPPRSALSRGPVGREKSRGRSRHDGDTVTALDFVSSASDHSK